MPKKLLDSISQEIREMLIEEVLELPEVKEKLKISVEEISEDQAQKDIDAWANKESKKSDQDVIDKAINQIL